jgi:UDP:flavonoid glycosyltransferase YjiC (YdhE family)
MAALTNGVPLVCVPGPGRDQEPIASRVAELELGIALARDASSDQIRDAVTAVLADRGYLERAQGFAQRSGQPDGARCASLALAAMLDEPAGP